MAQGATHRCIQLPTYFVRSMKCNVEEVVPLENSAAAPQIEHVDNHVHIPETLPATDSDPYYSFMVAEPMVNADPLATLEPTVAGDDEETNGE